MVQPTKTDVNYKQFVDRIIDMIYGNNSIRYDSILFQNAGNKLGKEIYAIGGYKALFYVMNLLEQELLNCEYSNSCMGTLREIEWSWHGICPEWQA